MRTIFPNAVLLIPALLLPGGAFSHDTPFIMDQGAFANYMALQPMRDRLEKSHQTLFGTSVETSLRASRTADRLISRSQNNPTALATGFRTSSAGPSTAVKMADIYPSAFRAQAASTFSELLVGFKAIEQKLGLPSNDVANGVAAFLVGNVWALHGSAVPDDHFVALVKQMRQMIAATPAFASASDRDKQEAYEQLAILGMLMATTQMALDRQPDAQIAGKARQAASEYLQTFLDTPASRVQISATGLSLK